MSDFLHVDSGKYWVRCGHLSRGVCKECLRRDILDGYEHVVGALRQVRKHLRDEDPDAAKIDSVLVLLPSPLRAELEEET